MQRRFVYNSFVSVFTQIIIAFLGILVPRFVIDNYGSDINGLIGTITQIFTYVALMESGISAATQNTLYKPIVEKNEKDISAILSASNTYYHKVTKWYALVTCFIAVIFPLLINSTEGYFTILSIILIEGGSSVVGFWYIEKWRALLVADGKKYIEIWIDFGIKISTYILKIFLCILGWNVVILSLIGLILSILKAFVYKNYAQKKYGWIIIKDNKEYKKILKDRNAYVISDVAWTAFSSTDMIILSIMFTTSMASVYSIYNMIYSHIAIMLNAFYTSVVYALGQAFYTNKEKYILMHDCYESFFISLMSILMSCCSVLAIPFVKLYTSGIDDINYIYYYLPIIMGCIQILSWDRYVSGNLVCVAGYAKDMQKYSIIEAVLNIILSIILGFLFGLYGITLATVLSLIFKVVQLTRMANNRILNRSSFFTIRRIVTNFAVYFIISIYYVDNPIEITDFSRFIVASILTFTCLCMVFLLTNIIFEHTVFKKMFLERKYPRT